MHKVLMFGNRDWHREGPIKAEITALIRKHGQQNILVIHGGASGADSLAGRLAASRGIHVAKVDALWEHYGRAAGPYRNQAMLELAPDEAIGFAVDIDTSRGSKNMRDKLIKADITVKIVNGKED